MTQNNLNHSIASRTGENESIIEEFDFLLQENTQQENRPPLVIDWDEVQSERHAGYYVN